MIEFLPRYTPYYPQIKITKKLLFKTKNTNNNNDIINSTESVIMDPKEDQNDLSTRKFSYLTSNENQTENKNILNQIKNNEKLILFKRISFSILSISLLISILTIIKLYNDYNNRESFHTENTTYTDLGCNTTECQNELNNVFKSLDRKVHPCEDFYQYACGNWITKYNTKLESYKLNNFNRFKELSKNNFKFLYDIIVRRLSSNDHTINNNTNSALYKVRKYFNICVEDSIVNKSNMSLFQVEIKSFLHEIGGWPLVPYTFKAKKWNLVDSLVTLQSYKIFPLFLTMTIADVHNSSINRMIFVENNLKIFENTSLMNNFIDFVLQFVKLLDDQSVKDEAKLRKYAKSIYLFELKLLDILKSHKSGNINKQKTTNDYKSYDYESLHRLFSCKTSKDGNLLNFEKYLNGIFKNFKNFNVKTQKYFIQMPFYFLKLCTLLAKTNRLVVASYIGLYALNDLISFMPFEVRFLKQNFINNFETTSKLNLLTACVKQTDDAFGYATGALFIFYKNLTLFFNDEIFQMTERLKETFIESIPNIEWMDEVTKNNAILKARHTAINVGYPKWITNETLLNRFYKKIVVTDLAFLNILSIRYASRVKTLERVIMPVDRTEWNMEPLEVNAYYTQSKNTIGFPIGILWDPFYNHFAVDALNYGGIGKFFFCHIFVSETLLGSSD
jgi:predicted metalloendopeptidase